ncbi:MAG: Na+/H+ antiporter family protein [Filifactoraceae bacterium]
MLLFNPVVISVLLLCILCLLKMDVLIALIISALVGGVIAGGEISEVMGTLINGMSGNSTTALSYILLGTLAAAVSHTGLASILSKKIAKAINGKGIILLLILAFCASLSQNLIPIHIAFIPILIPPLLHIMNELKLDRRATSCALAFGLKAPYIAIPAGFGLIFQGIIADNLTQNGMEVIKGDVWKTTWILGMGMVVGLLVAIFISYRKPREYKDLEVVGEVQINDEDIKMDIRHWGTIIGALVTLGIQLKTDSLPLGALVGIGIMVAFGAIKWEEMHNMIKNGIGLMGYVAFVMLVSAGYGAVIKATGGVDELVTVAITFVQGSKLMAAFVMIGLGLFITMGIGTSFGTVPILAVLYVPLCTQLGFSVSATILLIAAAAALGDAGSPASDTTLGPTAGLNADGQHDHIWDTCVPTFLHYNIPLAIFAIVGAMLL